MNRGCSVDEERQGHASDLDELSVQTPDDTTVHGGTQDTFYEGDPHTMLMEQYALPENQPFQYHLVEGAFRGLNMIGMGLGYETFHTFKRAYLQVKYGGDVEDYISPEEIRKEHPYLEIDEWTHPKMVEMYADRHKMIERIIERFKAGAFQIRRPMTLMGSWGGALGAAYFDRIERSFDNFLVSGITKGTALAGRGYAYSLRPAASIIAASNMYKRVRAVMPTLNVSRYGIIGRQLARTGKTLRYSAKARQLAKVGAANALIETHLAYQATTQGIKYDIPAAAAGGMMAPVMLSGLGMALKGAAKPIGGGLNKVITKIGKHAEAKKLAKEGPPKMRSIFKKGKGKTPETSRTEDMDFNKIGKGKMSLDEARGRVADANTNPAAKKALEDGLSGQAMLDNKYIRKIKSVFGVRGVKAAQDWANSVRAMGYRVDLEAAFPWLKKSVRALKEGIKTGTGDGPRSKNVEEAFDMPAERLYEYTNTHKMRERNPPTDPVRSEQSTKVQDDLEAKITQLSTEGGDLGKIGKSVRQVRDLTEQLHKCTAKGGGDTEGAA